MSQISQIREALISKLEGIEGVGVVRASAVPKLSTISRLPAAFLWRPETESEDGEAVASMRKVQRTARWPLTLIAKTEDDLEGFIVDVHEAIESDQFLGGLMFLGTKAHRGVLIEAVDIQDTTPEVARGFYPAMLTVRTIFNSLQGEL